MSAVRLQIACDDRLVAEVIVEPGMADRMWAHYACAKYRAGKPIGGAVMARADLPRQWDVPVGALIPFATYAHEQSDFKGGTLRMYSVHGGPHDRSTVSEETLRALGIKETA